MSRVSAHVAVKPVALGESAMNNAGEIARKLMTARGQTAAEYALVVATVVLVLIPLYQMSGTLVYGLLSRVLPLFQ